MPEPDSLYPPGPCAVPEDFTAPSPRYKERVILVLAGLFLFLLVYFGLFAGYAVLIISALRQQSIFAFWLALLAPFVYLFLLKGFFKGGDKTRSLSVEITEDEQPRLFAFIHRVCEDTRAPYPYRVYLTPDVNAAVMYEHSLIGLILPMPKNLLIGLGLVNVVNLSEFKAIMAHEFGHFSQNSMRLGHYVYRANGIIADLVFRRDWFDAFILRMRDKRGLAGALGWICWGVLWSVRKIFESLYYGINFLQHSLSREMEFNADLVAVSVTGSEPIVRGLARLDFASTAFEQAWNDLREAADHHLYTDNLFHHQSAAMGYLRRTRKNSRLGEPPDLPDNPALSVDIFEPEDGPPAMWSTHPSNYDREQNAKRRYLACAIDVRSPWLLFDNIPDVCERVSWRLYRVSARVPRDAYVDDAVVVQAFIDEEHGERTYDERYHGFYDNRYIDPGADATDEMWLADVIDHAYAGLYGEALRQRMTDHRRRQQECDFLQNWQQDKRKQIDQILEFRNKRYKPVAAERLLRQVHREMEQDWKWMSDVDREVSLVHQQMSRQLSADLVDELRERYEFHMALQRIARALTEEERAVQQALAVIAGKQQLAPQEFHNLLARLRQTHATLCSGLEYADRLRMPALRNMTVGAALGKFLWSDRIVRQFQFSTRSISGKKTTKLLKQLGSVAERARRMLFKSMGGILGLQEEIARQWTARSQARCTENSKVSG